MGLLQELNDAIPDLFRAIDLTGVFLNGILGGRLARQKGFDPVGYAVLALMSAMGGGIIRDVMLSAGPPIALTDPYYIIVAILGALTALLWKLDSRPSRVLIVIADGTVLGTWAATGAMKTLALGFGIMPAILMGMTTAVGGGMIRDISAGNVPMVFGGNELYATPAAVSSVIMVGFFHADLAMMGMLVATVVGSAFTCLANWRSWKLPASPDWTLTITSEQLRRLLKPRRSRPRAPQGKVRVKRNRTAAAPTVEVVFEEEKPADPPEEA
ncbi:trimeric intracellular cation channel family protein [Gleimia hominis]|uniref:Trimeric intracellular cation channel family protein n=1 Tax=Gleimia hominis TaxID=595468 RepID=A0ABU3I915_9ACTO|nr:trimeric intracellular cation channel family protein [Gleimia hominis]MDT3766856.1 trimeric intracellular cation channel family protein [Gleimia hominis]